MNLETGIIYIVVGIAIVLVVALWLAKMVFFKASKKRLSFFASKQDTVVVDTIDKSKVDIENREGQDVSVRKVKGNSNVKIR